MPTPELSDYAPLLRDLKGRIAQAQNRAALAVNAEMIHLYWDIGCMIQARQQQAGWGKGVIPRLARDLHNELPELKGFSERNIGYMIRFAREYALPSILQQPVAKLQNTAKKEVAILQQPVAQLALPSECPSQAPAIVQHLLAKVPWGHNILLMEKLADSAIRLWYAQQIIAQGWTRETLAAMIKNGAHARQGVAVTNFSDRLPAAHSELARQLLKDPYSFDFLTLTEPFHERELETGLVRHLEKFLVELGQGFAFVGRQYKLTVSDKDFYLDLIFYHLTLRCFVEPVAQSRSTSKISINTFQRMK